MTEVDGLVARIRAEADIAARSGQYASLIAIADDLAALAAHILPPASGDSA